MTVQDTAGRVVLVAVDGTAAALAATRAARELFPDAAPVLVSVVPVYEDPELDAGGIEGPAGNPETAERDYRAHRVNASGALAAAARELGSVPVRQLIVEDDGARIGAVLQRVADDCDATVVIVGRSHHGAITGLLTGSVEEYLVHHGGRPVLVVPEPAGP